MANDRDFSDDGSDFPYNLEYDIPTDSTANGRKDDEGKLPYHLVPYTSLEEIVKVLRYGAEKYGDNNWKKVRPFKRRYFAAMMRHIIAWWMGEKVDSESGLNHLAHAGCCLLFLLSKERRSKDEI